MGFPSGSAGKESTCNTGDSGDLGSIPGWGRFPGGRRGNPFQYFCPENPVVEEPGGLQSVGSQRVGQVWATNTLKLWCAQAIFQDLCHHRSVWFLSKATRACIYHERVEFRLQDSTTVFPIHLHWRPHPTPISCMSEVAGWEPLYPNTGGLGTGHPHPDPTLVPGPF